ncbi:uncharacterized protein LOC142174359 [Nicotiana tabacum]|uniref:Uncharacterized protein LOC142174359 n=1 Tax=Nicotiana tabacum TaxID=4097 RepID=A0AC58TG93_TOBAC
MAPYEELYGGGVDFRMVGLSLVRQKSYADRNVRDVAFMEGVKVLHRVLPMKGMMRFLKKGKLTPWYIGPFDILERVGKVAYKISLPPSLSSVHLVFYIFMIRKYHKDRSYVLDFISVQLDENWSYEEESVVILDRQVRKWSKDITSMMV